MKTTNDCIYAWIELYTDEKERRLALETAFRNLQKEKDMMQKNYEKRIQNLCKFSEKLANRCLQKALDITSKEEV